MFDEEYINKYHNHLTHERRMSANTIASYMRDIKQFTGFLKSLNKSTFYSVTKEEVQIYISSMLDKGKSPATVSRCIASLKSFYKRLEDEGMKEPNPTSGLSSISLGKKLPSVLSSEDIARLIAQPDAKDVKGCRDKAMLETLYATGVRVSELIALDVDDVNLITGLITCKTTRERTLPLNPAAKRAISNYLTFSRPKLVVEGETSLFVNTGGKRMSRQGFWKVLKSYIDKAQISVDVTPQMVRNSFAVNLIEKGADIRSLQKMLGHSDIQSTQVYARAVRSERRAVTSQNVD